MLSPKRNLPQVTLLRRLLVKVTPLQLMLLVMLSNPKIILLLHLPRKRKVVAKLLLQAVTPLLLTPSLRIVMLKEAVTLIRLRQTAIRNYSKS